MLLPKPTDAIHKAWMYRLLSAIADDNFLIEKLRFKGGTCAAMRGLIERFSVDLDFDLLETKELDEIRSHLEKIFNKLDLIIDDQSTKVPQYFLKYKNKPGQRNTIELDITFPPPQNNEYEPVRFPEIDRIIHCQTIGTMFSNKLVSVIDRFKKHGSIAGRDIFDIHSFFINGYEYRAEIIKERTGKDAKIFMKELKKFIEKHFTQTIIDQDLNSLLSPEKFKHLRKILKQEVLLFF